VHFERSHSGIPDINPDTHRLLIHGLVKRPLVFTLESLGRYPRGSRASPSSNVAATANCSIKKSPHRSGFRRFTVSFRAPNGRA
jgi:DMSO/TMAO reductase YedYZ molybdopterin-dependent catalytic subunit